MVDFYDSVKDWVRVEHRLVLRPRVVISHQKSGRTWLRVMLDELGIAAKYEHAVIRVDAPHLVEIDEREHRRYRRALVLVRDPRDVVVSHFHTATKRRFFYDGGLSGYVRAPRFGVEKVARYNLLWARLAAETPYIALLTYERLRGETEAAVADVVHFFRRRVPMASIARVVENNRIERMRAREARGDYRHRYGTVLTPGDPADPDSFKVRRGRVGGYRDEMSADDIAFCGDVLGRLDYFAKLDGFLRSASVGGSPAPWLYATAAAPSMLPQEA